MEDGVLISLAREIVEEGDHGVPKPILLEQVGSVVGPSPSVEAHLHNGLLQFGVMGSLEVQGLSQWLHIILLD